MTRKQKRKKINKVNFHNSRITNLPIRIKHNQVDRPKNLISESLKLFIFRLFNSLKICFSRRVQL